VICIVELPQSGMTDRDDITVRRLGSDDAAAYRGIRLEASNLVPETFGGSFGENREKPLPTGLAVCS